MMKQILLIMCFVALLLGCDGKQIVLHPITPSDIFAIPAGAQVEWEDDLMFVEKPGWFISDYYMNEVMKAKVE